MVPASRRSYLVVAAKKQQMHEITTALPPEIYPGRLPWPSYLVYERGEFQIGS